MIKPLTPRELETFPELSETEIEVINGMLIDNRLKTSDGGFKSLILISDVLKKLNLRTPIKQDAIFKYYSHFGWYIEPTEGQLIFYTKKPAIKRST